MNAPQKFDTVSGPAKFGVSQARIEDDRFLTGRGAYIDDLNLPGQAHAAIVRSPYPHARIGEIDKSEAEALPGVLLVMTGEDWVAAGYGKIPTKSATRTKRDGSPMNEATHHCLAVGKVRHVGEAVALVVAETPQLAREAAELVDVDYDDLDAVVDQTSALKDGVTQLWDEAPGNLCLDFALGDEEGTDAGFAKADHVVTLSLINNRVLAAPMEPRGVLADYDSQSGKFTLHNSSQNIHANRNILAAEILHIDPEALHHKAPDVGGGFGGKNSLYAEPALVLHAARALGRPVKWVADRSESFLSDTHGRDQHSEVSLALDKEGNFLALKVETIGNLGAWCGQVGPFTSTAGSARTQGGPYAFPALHYSAKAVYTNTAQTDPYRGAGRPEASFQVERVIEKAARELGFDRIELRRKNLLQPEQLPHTSPTGLSIDSGNFPELFRQVLEMSDYDNFPARAEEARARGKRRGYAIAPYLECSGGGPQEAAVVTFEDDGTITLAVGTSSTGMGHETAHPQILSARLGLPIELIHYRQADTDATPIGGGHGGSRGLEMGGSAVMKAADGVIEKAKAVAAHMLNSTTDDIEFEAANLTDRKTGQSVTLPDVIAAAKDVSRVPPALQNDDGSNALDTEGRHEREIITIPNGCHAAEVEVDPETGVVEIKDFWAVDDFGKVINPMMADGQVFGGVVQGLGQAMMEEIVYDPDSGQLVTGSLMDYALPRAADVPPMTVHYYEDAPTTRNPLGVKGAGEAGCCGAPPAIVNAVLDALNEYGVIHIEMPLTSQRVWRAIEDAKKS